MTEAVHNNKSMRSRFTINWFMKIIIIVVLLTLLIVINFIYNSISDIKITLQGEADDLLYVSAFDGFLDEWQLYDGQQSAQIINGAMQLDVTVANQATWSVTQPEFTDFDVTVSTRAVAGPIDNAYGIIFKLQSGMEKDCDLPLIILCGIGNTNPILNAIIRQFVDSSSGINSINYYSFLISSDGYYSVWKVENGVEKRLSAWISTPIINQNLNAENIIQVVARNSQLQFFINGEQMLLCIPDDPEAVSTYSGGECLEGTMRGVLTDHTISAGKLGVIAQATQTGGGGVAIQFDNMIVFSPSNKVESGESNA